jgi:hypothetical protein
MFDLTHQGRLQRPFVVTRANADLHNGKARSTVHEPYPVRISASLLVTLVTAVIFLSHFSGQFLNRITTGAIAILTHTREHHLSM